MEQTPAGARDWLGILRVHQWTKNLLIFVPVITAHRLLDWHVVGNAALAVVAFSLFASAAYIINDLVDLESDRRHSVKRNRPFARGSIPTRAALFLLPALLGISAFLVRLLPAPTQYVLLLYFAMTLLYSFRLKRVLLVDVFTLSGLYTIRIVAGDAATGIPLSPWLFAFSIFIFLSLAFSKRAAEMRNLRQLNQDGAHGRSYRSGDLEQLNVYGVVSGLMGSLVLALYISSESVHRHYAQPQILWLLCPVLLYWITRIWLLTARGEMNEDPIFFAIRDSVTYYIVAVAGVILFFATKEWIPGLDKLISPQ